MDKLLRLREVMERTGLGKSTIYRKISGGTFPKPVGVGHKSVRWRESDIAGSPVYPGELAPGGLLC